MACFAPPDATATPAGGRTSTWPDGPTWRSSDPFVTAAGTGLDTTAVDFPPGTDASFPFAPNEKLSVYAGDVVLRAHLTATPGDHLLQGALRYQACDANACMPPRKIPVAVSVLAK